MGMKRVIANVLLILILTVFSGCGYNTMQRLEEEVFSAWGDLESNLQRRADLIPNLVNTVKGYAAHEQQTLQGVIEARASATQVKLSSKDLSDPNAMEQFRKAQGEMSSALSRLMVIIEKYPDLKADKQFYDLMHQLEGSENRINVARQRYNTAVKDFNYAIRSFPNSLTNSLILKLERKEYFKAEEGAKAAPVVKF